MMKLSIPIMLVFVICSCATTSESTGTDVLCSNEWYLLVEQRVSTGDGQGHGPDLGSIEWRSTVEFKLGVRGKPEVPPVASTQWCSYINKNYIDI